MRTQRLLLLGAGLIAACSSSSHPSGPTTGVVHGVVTSSLGGGLTGLSVTVSPTSGAPLPPVMTGAGGAFTVLNVPLGSGSVSVSGQPALCTTPTSTAYAFGSADSAVANVRITCTQPTGSITGFATAKYGPDAQLQIPGAIITVTPSGGRALPAVTANGGGLFQVDSIPIPVVNGVAQSGSGTIVISGTLGAGCTAPVSVPYGGLTDTNTAASPLVVSANVPCAGSTLIIDEAWSIDSVRQPQVELNGPSGPSFLFAPFTYSPAIPGTYTVSAPSLAFTYDSILGTAANGHVAGSPVTLAPGATGTVTVTYAERPGSGQLWVTSSRGASGYTPTELNQAGIASGNTITIPGGAPRAVAVDTGGNLWVTGAFGVVEYAAATLPLRSGAYTAPSRPSFTFALPHASPGAAGLAFDQAGHLWVSDVAGAAIYEFNIGSATPIVTISGPRSERRSALRSTYTGTCGSPIRSLAVSSCICQRRSSVADPRRPKCCPSPRSFRAVGHTRSP